VHLLFCQVFMEWLPEGGWSLVVSSLLIVVASSKVLHHCPTLLHRRRTRELKKDPRFQATHIAHRGCRLEGTRRAGGLQRSIYTGAAPSRP
jgi:hypothetical protein